MERIWKYMENQMDIKTEDSVLVAIVLSKFYDTSLHNLSKTLPALLLAYTSLLASTVPAD